MARKSWFQHDFNAHLKDGLSRLLSYPEPFGSSYYGKFWLLQEEFCLAQQHNQKFSVTIKFMESKLCSILKTNRKKLPEIIKIFTECLGITFERCIVGSSAVLHKSIKRSTHCYKVTMPNSLIFIERRGLKITHKELELDKEQEKEESVSFQGNGKKENDTAFNLSGQAIPKYLWLKILRACNQNLYDAGLIAYRSKEKRKIVPWIYAGLSQGYAFQHCLDEDRDPLKVKEWVNKFVLEMEDKT